MQHTRADPARRHGRAVPSPAPSDAAPTPSNAVTTAGHWLADTLDGPARPAGKVVLFAPPAGAPSTEAPAATFVVHLSAGTPTTTVRSPEGVPVLARVVLTGTAQDSYDSLDLLARDLHTRAPGHPALAGLTGMAALAGTDTDTEPLDDRGGEDGDGGVITDADELFETLSDALPPPGLAGRVGGWPDPTSSRPHQDLLESDPATASPSTLLLQLGPGTTTTGTDDVHYWLTPTSPTGDRGDSSSGLVVHHITQH